MLLKISNSIKCYKKTIAQSLLRGLAFLIFWTRLFPYHWLSVLSTSNIFKEPPLCYLWYGHVSSHLCVKCDRNMNFNLTTVFKCPKRATKWVRLSCKIKQQNPGKLLNLESLFPGRALFKTRFQFYFIILVDTKRKWTKATVNTAEKSRRWWYSMEYELKVFF